MNRTEKFYSGTSNILVPLKQSQFPEEYKGTSRLTYYASLFSSLEVNASFYKLPKGDTVEKWAQSVPDHFRFTFKVPKTISHAKGLQFRVEEVELFVETVNRVGKKKGCLLVQLPPNITRDKEEEFTGLVEGLRDNSKGWNIAIEFRHSSWYDREVYRMLQHYKVGMVEQDMPKSLTPKVEVSKSFVYLRFHGTEDRYRGSYEVSVLKEYAKRIKTWLKEKKEVYVYFNNTMGNALGDLQNLNKLVNKS